MWFAESPGTSSVIVVTIGRHSGISTFRRGFGCTTMSLVRRSRRASSRRGSRRRARSSPWVPLVLVRSQVALPSHGTPYRSRRTADRAIARARTQQTRAITHSTDHTRTALLCGVWLTCPPVAIRLLSSLPIPDVQSGSMLNTASDRACGLHAPWYST